jgi:energy-coupling factor transport system substrate-specific component
MNRINIQEFVFIVVIGAALGVAWGAYTLFFGIVAPLLKVFMLDGILSGPWLVGSVFFGYIIRKPGSAILGETVAAIIETVLSSWGIGSVIYAVAQSVPVECLFLILRYRVWNVGTICLAGVLAGAGNYALNVLWFQYYKFSLLFNIIEFSTTLISGAISCLMVKIIADRLCSAQILTQFKIYHDCNYK